jgi:hypothetical protein
MAADYTPFLNSHYDAKMIYYLDWEDKIILPNRVTQSKAANVMILQDLIYIHGNSILDKDFV